MMIDRHNYEEYFILYLDNELSPAERSDVEAFAKAHPDLQEELDILLQSKLVPDHHIVFKNKEELLSFTNNDTISLSNYDEWLVLYMDNELNAEQRIAVEQFATAHPAVQDDLSLLLQTKTAPEQNIVFPDKKILYRREEKNRPVMWWRIAAAAAVLIAIATTAVIFLNKKPGKVEDIVSINPPVKTAPQKNIPAVTNSNTTVPAVETTIVKKEPQKVLQGQLAIASFKKQDSKTKKPAATGNELEKKKEPVVSDNVPQEMISESTIAAITPKINTTIEADKLSRLTNPKEKIETPTVTPRDVQPLYASTTSSKPINDDGDDGKKSKLRGFLRKVTRTFEKKTNIDATDDDDRLLVGGLAIRLK